MTTNGNLLVFEGPDGVGKSTLVGETLSILRQKGIPFGTLAFPGKDPGTLGWTVDQIHHNPSSLGIESLTPLSLQALHIAAHLDHIEARILPALAHGQWFVLDRFWWSASVYGTANAVNPQVLEKLVATEQAAWLPVVPATASLVEKTRTNHSSRFSSTSASNSRMSTRSSPIPTIIGTSRVRVRSLSNEINPIRKPCLS